MTANRVNQAKMVSLDSQRLRKLSPRGASTAILGLPVRLVKAASRDKMAHKVNPDSLEFQANVAHLDRLDRRVRLDKPVNRVIKENPARLDKFMMCQVQTDRPDNQGRLVRVENLDWMAIREILEYPEHQVRTMSSKIIFHILGFSGDAGTPGPPGLPGKDGKPGEDGGSGSHGGCEHCPPPRTAPGY